MEKKKRMKFKFMDPNDIISVIVVLIVLGVGVYAFFITVNSISSTTPKWSAGSGYYGRNLNDTEKALKNASNLGGSVFNILGIVITIGAIMSIIGVIYGYLRPQY
jgi:S1-C subfamily serine protease